ncbi:recombinase family protein [Rothia sp. CCM 9418]|uniref:recombinase family protein n=1 Tax=Rothia sp. CCM 9418 TaxID=3402661 RepID=UPI003AE5AEF7
MAKPDTRQRTIERIPTRPITPKRLRVAAYARVSETTGRLPASLSAQVSHYSRLIQSTPGWEYAGVFSDLGTSGTSTNRAGFNQLMNSAKSGHIDVILCKSISRLARNTVDLLETIRQLRALGVGGCVLNVRALTPSLLMGNYY